MIKKKCTIFLFLLLEIAFFKSYSQKPTFQSGEKLVFEVAYNLNFIWVPAGEAILTVKSIVYNNKDAFMYEATGNSLKNYDWFFKVRNKYTSISDKNNFIAYSFERYTNEGSKKVVEKFTINHVSKKVYEYYKFNDKPAIVDTLSFETSISDAITAAYSLRGFNYTQIKKDDKINIPIVINNKIFPFYVRYLGKDVLVSHDKHFYSCHKFSALAIEGTVFKGGEDIFVWVSDDNNHLPVQIEAKILVGSIKMQLRTTENLLYPFKAFIK